LKTRDFGALGGASSDAPRAVDAVNERDDVSGIST